MKKILPLAFFIFLVTAVSGCTTTSTYLLNVSHIFTDSTLNYWENYAFNIVRTGNPLFQDRTNITIFSEVCPVHEEEFGENRSVTVYYLGECDFSRSHILRNSTDYGAKISYVQLSSRKAHSILVEKISSTFSEFYAAEEVAEDSHNDIIIENIINRIIDTSLMVFLAESESNAWVYMMTKVECNESASCVDSTLGRMEEAIPRINQETDFSATSPELCRDYLQETDRNQTFDELRYILGDVFQKTGYYGNPDDFINYNKICQRSMRLYSQLYRNALAAEEPAQMFYISATFYMLNRLGESPEGLYQSLNQLISGA